jgi:hypothetical protein
MTALLTTFRLPAGVVALGLLAAPAAAHHSASMYDRSKVVELKGVVKAFNWVNPHCSIIFVAEGGGETWNVESTSPGVLTRTGWTKRSLNPGDRIAIKVAPLRTGGPAGIAIEVTNLETNLTFR